MKLVNMTLAVPDDLKEKMEEFPEMNWSEVARQAIRRKITDLEALKILDRAAENSTMTEEEAIVLGRELKRRMARHYPIRKEEDD